MNLATKPFKFDDIKKGQYYNLTQLIKREGHSSDIYPGTVFEVLDKKHNKNDLIEPKYIIKLISVGRCYELEITLKFLNKKFVTYP